MTGIDVKRYRLLIAVPVVLALVLGFGSTQAAINELDIKLNYTSRFCPPMTFDNFPGGISAIKQDSYLFKLKTIDRSWSIDILPTDNYITMTLYVGNYALYNPLSIHKDNYFKYVYHQYEVDGWLDDMAGFSGTKGKGTSEEGFEFKFSENVIPKSMRSIVGEGGPRINVSGSRKISFSGRSQWDDLPQTGTFKQSKFPSLHMEQTSRFKIKGQIGSKITIEVDQDSNRDVDIANTLKLRYKGEDDEIIQSIEAGNTNLSLPNSQFIGFSQNVQGLFGIKATAKIGNMELTMITSQEKGSNEKSTFSAGAQSSADTIWDYRYLHNVYFYLGNFQSGDQIIDLKLYVNGTEGQDIYGLACVDPRGDGGSNGGIDTIYYASSEEMSRNEWERRYFKQLTEGVDYDSYRSGKYFILNQQLNESEALAAYIKYTRDIGGGLRDTLQEGKIVGDTLVLKLIRDPNTDKSFTTWDLEWKNVYDLHSRNVTSDGFKLEIYKGVGDLTTDTLTQNDTTFVTLFGFDKYNNSSPTDETPDGIFDFNTTRPDIDPARGHLIFHEPEPFISSVLRDPNPAVYNYKYDNQNRSESKKYYIYVQTSKRSSSFTLGKTNIIEGSEVVKLGDGRILKRGVDYNIVYEIGQITFLNEDALSEASDISVDFEYSPIFMPEKKSLFGLAAVYNINDKSMFSISGMYRKESSKEYRPRVGREPTRSMIWDSNIVLHFEPHFLTDMVDALPLIETDEPSNLELSGEVAQSFPNPNLRNTAFIDDFEGARQSTDLIMKRGIWTKASPPIGYDHEDFRKFWWYNPFNSILISDIWEEKANAVEDYDNRQDVLFLEYWPDTTAGPDFEGWGGIMRGMYSGLADQSRTKFIEIWYLPDTLSSEYPILYIDCGDITEDLNDNEHKDTEDRNSNGVFDSDEDTGLDTLTNEQERIVFGEPNVEDPSGDDWYYRDGNTQEQEDYTHVNGTEGNRNDPDRLNRIDTEDINNNGTLDLSNSYYQFAVDLENSSFIQDSTSTGWKLIRIPFQDSTAYETFGNPDRQSINFIRVWMAGVAHHYLLRMATLEFVGNKWQELAPPDSIMRNGVSLRPSFEISVKNTQENAETYQSPPGVYGEYNQSTDIQEKEQSLVLHYENLRPGQQVGAYWTLLQPEDYTLYNKLKMFVHGDANLDEDKPVYFFFRMGLDSTSNYYEYRTKLYPEWDERNYIDIDFSEITALKAYRDSADVNTLYTDGHYGVKGNPSLSLVKMFVLGIEYDSLMVDTVFTNDGAIDTIIVTETPNIPIDGETWCDELVVTDVRRASDFAGRFSAKLKLADLGNITFNYSRTGAEFFKLTAKKPEGSLSTTQSISGSFNADKLFPPSLGLTLPVTASWQKTLQLPRLKTGSDIILPNELRDQEKTENRSWQFSISESFRKNTNNWLFNWTLNRIQTRFNYSKKYGTNPTTPVNNGSSYEAKGSYDLTPKAKPFLKPFTWMKNIFLPKSIYDVKMFYLPTGIKYDGNVKSTRTYSITRNIARSTFTREFTGTQSYGLDLFSELKADFSSTTNRDISDSRTLKFSFNPRKILLGRERTYSQAFNLSFSPKLSRQLTPRVSFNSKYSDNSDVTTNTDSTRTTRQNATIRGDITLDILKITHLDKLLAGSQPKANQSPAAAGRNEPAHPDSSKDEKLKKYEEEEEEKGEGEIGIRDKEQQAAQGETGEEGEEGEPGQGKKGMKIPNPLAPMKKTLVVFRVLNTLKPLKSSITLDKQLERAGLYERPGWSYTLGFVDQPDVRRKEETTSYVKDKVTRTIDYQFQSGVTPFRNLDMNTSYKFRESTSRNSNSTIGTRTKSVEFPRVDGSLSGLEKLPFFAKITQTVKLQSTYSVKVDETGNPDNEQLDSRNTSTAFAPLMSLNMVLKKSVNVTIRYDLNKKKNEDLRTEGSNGRVDFDEDRALKLSVSYSLTSPQGIKMPIFGRLKFNSQLTMSMDISKTNRKSWFFIDEEKSVDASSDEISIDPRLTYRFSAKVTGGMNAKWSDSNDKLQNRKRHIRELGIWTELRF